MLQEKILRVKKALDNNLSKDNITKLEEFGLYSKLINAVADSFIGIDEYDVIDFFSEKEVVSSCEFLIDVDDINDAQFNNLNKLLDKNSNLVLITNISAKDLKKFSVSLVYKIITSIRQTCECSGDVLYPATYEDIPANKVWIGCIVLK